MATDTPAEIVWRPSPEHVSRTRLWRFLQRHGIPDYPSLVARAAQDPAWFWDAAVRDLELEFYQPYRQVMDTSRGIQWTTWFTGGAFNYVHNAVDKHARSPRADAPALVWEGEEGRTRALTYLELHAEVNQAANALKALGLGKGDRVGIYMPMCPETVIATLACSKIGAVFVPIFSGYAPAAVAARLNDAGAALLITADGFYRRGQVIHMKDSADEAVALSPGVRHVLVSRRVGMRVPMRSPRDLWWDELVGSQSQECATERTDPEDVYMLIYTSGTTGRPKGAVHTHNGFPIKSTQDMAHCFDVQPSDTVFWFTDIGWMMGPWVIVGTLTLGATLFLYDGTPDYPSPARLWELVERHHVTLLGISPTAIRGLMRFGADPVRGHDLSSLRTLGSTGEPWNPVPWYWYFHEVGGRRIPVINYSGGTEVSGGIVCGNHLTPLKPCSFAGPVPGMAADVVDEHGRSVRGQVGELVIRQPWPGMTRGFWNDPQRYLDTYWSRWPDLWVHGDWARVDEDGFWFIEGRSDDTIKVAGKRLGPAEVESAAVSHPAVAEAAAIGVPHDLKGEAAVVFVVLRPSFTATEALGEEILDAVAAQLGKALRPDAVRFVTDLPRTRNAKVLRRLIRAVYLGVEDLGDTSALENPAALEEIREFTRR